MAQGITDDFAHKLLDYLFGAEGVSPTDGASFSPDNWFLGLLTTFPNSAGAGAAEPTAVEYARISTAAADWTAAASRDIENANPITFAEVTTSEGWGTIVGFGLYDALTGGNLRMVGAFASGPQSFIQGAARQFKAGDLTLSFPWTA